MRMSTGIIASLFAGGIVLIVASLTTSGDKHPDSIVVSSAPSTSLEARDWLAPHKASLPVVITDPMSVVDVWCENVSPFWDKNGNPSPEQKSLILTDVRGFVMGNCVNVTSARKLY